MCVASFKFVVTIATWVLRIVKLKEGESRLKQATNVTFKTTVGVTVSQRRFQSSSSEALVLWSMPVGNEQIQ